MAVSKLIFLLGLALISIAVATTDDLKPSSLPTVLPPEKPGESEDPCAFSDLEELLGRLRQAPELYNSTLLVETCGNICQLLYGTGNPDLSGIGMMSSYAIQGAVLLAFGPFFLVAIILIDGRNDPFSYARSQSRSRWVNLVLKLGLPTHRVNSFAAVCVVVSVFIRQDINEPLFEAYFTDILAFYQVTICILSSASYMLFCPANSNRQCTLQFVLNMVAGAYLFAPLMGGQDGSQGRSANFFQDCAHMRGYPPAISPTRSPNIRFYAATIVLGPFVALAFLTAAFRLFRRRHVRNTNRTSMRVLRHVRQAFNWCASVWLSAWGDGVMGRLGPGPVGALCAAAILTIGVSFGIIETYNSLQSTREKIRGYSQDEFEDNNWGFGQVLAVAVWVTWLVDAVLLISEDISSHDYVQTCQARPDQDTELSDQTANRRQTDHVQSSNSESQEQTTGVVLTAPHPTSAMELDITDSHTLRSRPTWPRNDRNTYLP